MFRVAVSHQDRGRRLAHQGPSLRAILYALPAGLGMALARTRAALVTGSRPLRQWLKQQAPPIGWCFIEPDCRD
jgi:hypothetical protein